MFTRVFSGLIVVFWLIMTTLLIRTEVQPDQSGLRKVPFDHVLKLLYLHEQPSELLIHADDTRIGHLRIHPQIRKEDGMRTLDFVGNVMLKIPGATHERLTWDGLIEFQPDLSVKSATVGLSFKDPNQLRTELLFTPAANEIRIDLKSQGETVERETITMDEAGLRKLMKRLQVDPSLLDTVRSRTGGSSELIAQQSKLEIHGEWIETVLVTFRQNGQTLFEAHVSQLGQILKAKTVIGWTLAPDDLMP